MDFDYNNVSDDDLPLEEIRTRGEPFMRMMSYPVDFYLLGA